MNFLTKIVCVILYITILICEATAFAKECAYCKSRCPRLEDMKIKQCSDDGPGDYYCKRLFIKNYTKGSTPLYNYEVRDCVVSTDNFTINECREVNLNTTWGYMCYICTENRCNVRKDKNGIQINRPIFLVFLLGCAVPIFF